LIIGRLLYLDTARRDTYWQDRIAEVSSRDGKFKNHPLIKVANASHECNPYDLES